MVRSGVLGVATLVFRPVAAIAVLLTRLPLELAAELLCFMGVALMLVVAVEVGVEAIAKVEEVVAGLVALLVGDTAVAMAVEAMALEVDTLNGMSAEQLSVATMAVGVLVAVVVVRTPKMLTTVVGLAQTAALHFVVQILENKIEEKKKRLVDLK
ncbi:hypothetical protein ACLOJK_033876 [Asimina triloba]